MTEYQIQVDWKHPPTPLDEAWVNLLFQAHLVEEIDGVIRSGVTGDDAQQTARMVLELGREFGQAAHEIYAKEAERARQRRKATVYAMRGIDVVEAAE